MTVPVMNVVPIRSAAGVIGSEFVSALAGKSSHPLRCGRHWISTMAVDGRILFPSAPLRASLDPESHRSFGQWLFPSAPLRASLDRFGSLFRGDVRFPSAPLRASLDLFWKKKKKRRKPRSHPLRCGRHWIFDHRRPPRWPVSSHPLRCGRHWIKGQTMYRYLLKFPSAPLRASLDQSASLQSRFWSSHPLRCGRHWIMKRVWSLFLLLVPIRSAAGVIGSLYVVCDSGLAQFPSAPLRASLDPAMMLQQLFKRCSHPLRCGRHWILSSAHLVRRASSHPLRCGRHWILRILSFNRRGLVPIRSAAGVIGSRVGGQTSTVIVVPIRSAAGVIGSRDKEFRYVECSHPLRCGRHWIALGSYGDLPNSV